MDTTPQIQPPSQPAWKVPSWLARFAAIGWRVLVTVAFGAFVVGFALYLSTVTFSILFAVIAVATLGPFNERMRARGWGAAKAAGASIGAAVLIVGGALLLIALALIPFLIDVTQYLQAGLDRLSAELASASVPADVAATIQEAILQVETWLSEQASSIVDGLVEAGTIVMLGLFLTFYLLLDGDKAWDLGLSELDGWRRDRIRAAGDEAMRRAGGYVRGTAMIAAVDATVSFVVLTLIGVPLAGPLAVLVLAAGFIPYIGGLFAGGILVLAGLAVGGLPTAVLLLLVVIVLKFLEQRRLPTFLANRTLELHPAVILLALLVGFTLGGLAGMFVAVPTIAVVMAVTGAVLDVLGTSGKVRVSVQGDIPAWLDRLAQWSWRLLVAVGLVGLVVAILSQFPVVVGPIVVAITLAATFLPAVATLERRGWTRGRASFVVSIVVWTTVSVVTALSITALGGSAQEAIQAAIAGGSAADDSLPDGVSGTVGQLSHLVGTGILETLASFVSGLAAALLFFVITALLAYFMLRDGDRGWAWITSHLDGWRRTQITVAGDRAVTMLGGYMIATGVLAMFNAVTGFIIMTLLGLPLALPVAILSFFGGIHPVHRPVRHEPDRLPRRRRVRHDRGHHHHGDLDRRPQRRPGQCHRAAGLRPSRQPPPRDGADRDPGGWRARRHPGHVPRRARGRDHRGGLAQHPRRHRRSPDRGARCHRAEDRSTDRGWRPRSAPERRPGVTVAAAMAGASSRTVEVDDDALR